MRWRWDQGRLDYFRFDMIKRIAGVLCSLENADLSINTQDPLRQLLVGSTQLPFSPGTYKVWRNYKRVFGCCMLSAEVGKRMICTEICHRLASSGDNELDADAYFTHFTRRFYAPSPVFEGYTQNEPQVFPVCAILKFLLMLIRTGQKASITADEVVNILIANNCTGNEPVHFYENLIPRTYTPETDEIRQIRELLRFVSQMSFLKWMSPNLILDVDPSDIQGLSNIETLAQPIRRDRNADPARELLQIGITGELPVTPLVIVPASQDDLYFSEGKPKRVSHIRYERSPKLRELFFIAKAPPFRCDMCTLNVSHRYNWTDNILELHHLLPLASPLRIEHTQTSLSELAALCPSCHKATHIYYRQWLNTVGQDDFSNYKEAHMIYHLAKKSVVIKN